MKHIYLSTGGKIFSELVPDNFWKQSKEDREIYIVLTWPEAIWAGNAKENASIEHTIKADKLVMIKGRGGNVVNKASRNFAEFMQKQDAELAAIEAERKQRIKDRTYFNQGIDMILKRSRERNKGNSPLLYQDI